MKVLNRLGTTCAFTMAVVLVGAGVLYGNQNHGFQGSVCFALAIVIAQGEIVIDHLRKSADMRGIRRSD